MLKLFSKNRRKALLESKLALYLRYAIGEIILVVIGILIALKINNANEAGKYHRAELEYLKELKIDFEANLDNSLATIDWIEFIVPRLIILLEESAKPQSSLPLDSLNFYYALSLEMPTYISTDRVYDNLIGSGDFKLISSNELKNAIASYYKLVDLIGLVQTTHELELVESYQPYTINNLDFQAIQDQMFDKWDMPVPVDSSRILSVLHEAEFRNIITLKLMILSDLLSQNQNILEANRNLINILDRVSNEMGIES